MAKKETVEWRGATYDVWGNEEDGFEVNDVFERRTVEGPYAPDDIVAIKMGQEAGVLNELMEPDALLEAIEIGGDDLVIYFDQKSNGFPLGELTREE